MTLHSYEWPNLVDDEFANQIFFEISESISADGICSQDSYVMFGQADDEAAGARVTVLTDEGTVIGYALYNAAEFKEIYVLEQHRGNGYADVILEEAKKWYRSKEIEDVDVNIALSEQARRFWNDRAIHGFCGEAKLLLD